MRLLLDQNVSHRLVAPLSEIYPGTTQVGFQSVHAKRLRLILGRLHAATSPQDMNLPGLFFHQLSGRYRGRFSVRVSGNWRVTFKFEGPDASVVDYEDYH